MKEIYLVVIDFLKEKNGLAPNIYWFSEKEKAINFSKEQIEYRKNIYKNDKNKWIDYIQWGLYIPWKIDIRVRNIPIDFYISNKDYQNYINSLSKN